MSEIWYKNVYLVCNVKICFDILQLVRHPPICRTSLGIPYLVQKSIPGAGYRFGVAHLVQRPSKANVWYVKKSVPALDKCHWNFHGASMAGDNIPEMDMEKLAHCQPFVKICGYIDEKLEEGGEEEKGKEEKGKEEKEKEKEEAGSAS